MTKTRWLTRPEQLAWKAYLDSQRLLMATLEKQLNADSTLSFADYEVLVALSDAPEHTIRMSELANTTLTTRSGMTRAMTRLEGLGLVVREKCLEDGRGTNARLLPAGLEALRKAAPGHVASVRENLFDLLDSDEVASMRRIAEKMTRHMTA